MHFPTSSLTIDVVDLPNGLPVSFDGQDLVLGAVTFQPRPDGHPPGSSSPQWINTMVLGPTLALAQDAARAAAILDDPDPSCTGSSKEVLLIVAGAPGMQTTRIQGVQVLVTQAVYDLTATGKPMHIARAVRATSGKFDTDPGEPATTRDAQAWRVMSDFCETLFRNFG